MRVLSFDPGNTTGWAYQDGENDYPSGILDFGQLEGLIAVDDFLRAWNLETRPVDWLVVEGFRNFSVKATYGSENFTSQVLGIIEVWGLRHKIPCKKYFSHEIDNVAKIVGVNPRKGKHKNTHWLFAANYGRHHLIKCGKAKSAIQVAKEK